MREVVLAHSSTLVEDVLARALVLQGLRARPAREADVGPDDIFVCDARMGRRAHVLLGPGGAVSTDSDVSELVDVVSSAAAGDPAVAATKGHAVMAVSNLTPREREVLALVGAGASNASVAQALGISRNTARTHVQNVLSKLQVESRLAAGALARQHGLATGGPR